MLSSRNLLNLFAKGEMETLARYCQRYGDIISDDRWEDAADSEDVRFMTILCEGFEWAFTWKRGELKEVGYIRARHD